jgi:DNA polymerase-3 subunit delta'
MWQTFGHNAAKQLLGKQLERRKFPHSYLFAGPQGIGKKMLASEMASRILNAEGNLASHADYIFYDAADGDGMDGLRQFLARLANKPFIGEYKIAIIDNMDQASPQISNALLKTLEEPSPSTIMFLLSGQNNLLPTIVSRSQPLTFNPLDTAEMKAFAQTLKLTISDELIAASFGSPARLQLLVNEPALTDLINSSVAQLETAYSAELAEKLLTVSALAELEIEQLRDILLTWLYRQRQVLSQQPQRARAMSRACEALAHLNGSFNKKMVLQRLILPSYEMA